jgi:hypothetical protein
MDKMHRLTLALLVVAQALDLAPLSKLRAVSLARPPESRLIAGKLDDSHVALWKWKEATMGDGAGAACTGVERALAERVKAATGGEAIVLSTCARLDVYSFSDADKDLAAIVSSDIGGAATAWRAARLFAPRYAAPVEPTLASRSGADAARHVFEVACFAGLERCEFDPFDSHQAHVVKQIKAAFDDAARNNGPCGTRLSALLRLALETGKAARDGKSVRAINTLRGKALDAVALATARQEVAAAVEERVLEPAVLKAAEAYAALDAGPRLRELSLLADAAVAEAIRSAPSAASREADLTRAARKALHGPLMRVRAGEAVLAEDASADVRAAVAEALATAV